MYQPNLVISAHAYPDPGDHAVSVRNGQLCCGLRELTGLSWLGREHGGRVVTGKDILLGSIQQIWGFNPLGPEYAKGYGKPFSAGSPIIGCAFVFFTEAHVGTNQGYGRRFADWLRENNLGEVTAVGPQRNTNSGNLITVYVWAPHHDSVYNYVKREWV